MLTNARRNVAESSRAAHKNPTTTGLTVALVTRHHTLCAVSELRAVTRHVTVGDGRPRARHDVGWGWHWA